MQRRIFPLLILDDYPQRPDIKAPRYEVIIHDLGSLSPGYWFAAPYSVIDPEDPTKKWMPCQVGPHIYDGNGVRSLSNIFPLVRNMS
jgi:hypothetical protein